MAIWSSSSVAVSVSMSMIVAPGALAPSLTLTARSIVFQSLGWSPGFSHGSRTPNRGVVEADATLLFEVSLSRTPSSSCFTRSPSFGKLTVRDTSSERKERQLFVFTRSLFSCEDAYSMLVVRATPKFPTACTTMKKTRKTVHARKAPCVTSSGTRSWCTKSWHRSQRCTAENQIAASIHVRSNVHQEDFRRVVESLHLPVSPSLQIRNRIALIGGKRQDRLRGSLGLFSPCHCRQHQ